MVVHVEDDVLPHDGQPVQGDVGDGLRHAAVVVVVAGGAFRAGGAEADAHCNNAERERDTSVDEAAGGVRVIGEEENKAAGGGAGGRKEEEKEGGG